MQNSFENRAPVIRELPIALVSYMETTAFGMNYYDPDAVRSFTGTETAKRRAVADRIYMALSFRDKEIVRNHFGRIAA